MAVNSELVRWAQRVSPEPTATIDMDATLMETHKQDALMSYKGYRGYQPMNVYWGEQGLVVRSEFRDGNVGAGHQQLRVLQETLADLPEGVERVYMRSDTAGYQWDLLHYCGRGENERFGRIGFAVGCDVTQEFRRAVQTVASDAWRPVVREIDGIRVPTSREWAQVCYVPEGAARRKDDPDYRFIAVREALGQQPLPGMASELTLPFQTMDFDARTYKLFGLVTNLNWPGGKIVRWLNARCGKSEEVHAVQKDDLAGGTLPSGLFGANAGWWQMMVIALNLNAIMKRRVLKGEWEAKRMKAMRFGIINLPGSFVMHANRTWLKVSADEETFRTLVAARATIAALSKTLGPHGSEWRPPPA
jgi:hypothetical protein